MSKGIQRKNLSMAVVIRNGKVLVQERLRPSLGMVFEFPGGAVDNNESAEEAAIRELWEETGLKDLSVVGSHTLVSDFGGDIHYVIFHAKSDAEPAVVDQDRRQTFHWFDPKDIPRRDFFRADIEFMDAQLLDHIEAPS